jgi:hypothetical protein
MSLTAHYTPQWPECLNPSAMERLQMLVGYRIREANGARIAEPASGVGPAYVQDPETEWWRYVYDVAC